MIDKAIRYFKATNGKKSMKIQHQISSGLSRDDFIDIYDHYDEWCLILACMIVTRKRLSRGKVKRIIDDIFGEERLK